MAFVIGVGCMPLTDTFVLGVAGIILVDDRDHAAEQLNVRYVLFFGDHGGFFCPLVGWGLVVGGGFVFLVFFVGVGFTQWRSLFDGGLAAVLVTGHVDEEPAAGTDSLALAPGGTCAAWVEVAVADYFREFEWVGIGASALLVVVAVTAISTSGVVVVVFHLSVGGAVVFVTGCPV